MIEVAHDRLVGGHREGRGGVVLGLVTVEGSEHPANNTSRPVRMQVSSARCIYHQLPASSSRRAPNRRFTARKPHSAPPGATPRAIRQGVEMRKRGRTGKCPWHARKRGQGQGVVPKGHLRSLNDSSDTSPTLRMDGIKIGRSQKIGHSNTLSQKCLVSNYPPLIWKKKALHFPKFS
jgi:hypothetical protein